MGSWWKGFRSLSFFGPALVVVGAFLIVGGVWGYLVGNASEAWPSTPGEVKKSWIEEYEDRGTSQSKTYTKYFDPHVTYSYTVEGVAYTGSRIRVGHPTHKSHQSAAKVIAPYTVGTTIPVYYDPTDPADSLLEPGGGLVWLIVGVQAGLFTFGLLFFLTWHFRKLQAQQVADPGA